MAEIENRSEAKEKAEIGKAESRNPDTGNQFIFRLLLQQFRAMIGETTNGRHPVPATLWRVTVESWLRCQGLIPIRQNQNVSTTFQNIWSQN
jgi:hypothetical protein